MPLCLHHALTTKDLAILNRQLEGVLLNTPLDEALLQNTIEKRADLVESLLNTLHTQERRCFATFEIKSNDIIIEAVDKQRNAIKAELAKINKASKAIKKYQQV